MIQVSILYPNRAGARFDMEYYLHSHIPLCIERLGRSQTLRGVEVQRGLAGAAPGTAPAFIALCHFRFASLADFQDAFGAHATELQGDIPNYTDVAPVIQISEVAVSR
jgi:uncharacterized protein (TIGR02118 family)